MKTPVLDAIGVGFGPANLALAVAMRDQGVSASIRFQEMRKDFAWQPTMMLRGSDIQHNPLRDLITPVNPRSPFGFVSYMHQSGRFFEYLNLGAPYPLRREFAAYVEWVAEHFDDVVDYDAQVEGIEIVPHQTQGPLARITRADGRQFHARNVVVGPGRSRNIPKEFRNLLGPKVFHLMDYLPRLTAMKKPKRIAVIGGSQSAVEILLDLDSRFPDAEITGITRKFGYRLKDTSPFTGEVYFPDFTDYYHAASWENRMALSAELRGTNYASADGDVINQLYLRRYESKLEGQPQHLAVLGSSTVERARETQTGIEIDLIDTHSGHRSSSTFDAVVLATGFLDFGTGGQRELSHPLIQPLMEYYDFTPGQGFEVSRDYALIGDPALPGIYLNGLCESTHGFGDAGSFSLLSLRAHEICKSLGQRIGTAAHTASPVRETELA